MNHRPFRALIYVLVAAQLLLSAPVSHALATSSHAAAEMPCADSMPAADDGKPCPCCPEGAMDMAACLSACTASVGVIPTISLPQRVNLAAVPDSAPGLPPARHSDPPLKPPPIA